ncbi:DUF4153 domain-containing protein [Aureivirga marina]|uniref:hypothetical protein n=1 Tax=Aureivirga marina TaxID=1182451 RepID=UPI0018C9A6C8|nr:hypothetical protein [Aureivirga marina]
MENNIFDERFTAFKKGNYYKKLKKEFSHNSYDRRRLGVYIIAILVSVFCNLFSIFSESTFIFSYLNHLVANTFGNSFYFTITVTVFVIATLEAASRVFTYTLIKEYLQYGIKFSSFVIAAIVLFISYVSVFSSYHGGKEVPKLIKEAPKFLAPTLLSTKDVEKQHNAIIENYESIAQRFYNKYQEKIKTNEWFAKQYDNRKKKVIVAQENKAEELKEIRERNQTKEEKAERKYENLKSDYDKEMTNKGNSLAYLSILFQVIYFPAMFFSVYYRYRSFNQFKKVEEEKTQTTDIEILWERTRQEFKNLKNDLVPTPILETKEKSNLLENKKRQNKIGYDMSSIKKTDEKTAKHKNTTQLQSLSRQELTDIHTVPHKKTRVDKTKIKNNINIYKKRVEEAEKGTDVYKNRFQNLEYWQSKLEELNLQIEKYNQSLK